jgi:hypothetical protein
VVLAAWRVEGGGRWSVSEVLVVGELESGILSLLVVEEVDVVDFGGDSGRGGGGCAILNLLRVVSELNEFYAHELSQFFFSLFPKGSS